MAISKMVLVLLIINTLLAVPYAPNSSAFTAKTGLPAESGHLPNSTNFSTCARANITAQSGNPLAISCTVTPTDDAYVDNLIPTQPFGDLGVLVVQDTPSIPKSRNYAYLKFDLPGTLPSDIIQSHAKPVNSSLWLYVRFISTSFNASIGVYYVPSNEWNESTLTWDNRPSQETINYEAHDVTANGTWYHWDTTTATDLATAQGGPVSLAVMPTSNAWRNYLWFDSKEHRVAKQSTQPKLDLVFIEPHLSLETRIPNLPITIGNQTFEADANGNLGAYLPWGTYNVAVPEVVSKGDGVRERFVGWSDNVTAPTRAITLGNNLTLSAKYQTQYRLDVSSPYASAGGSGWYFAKERANASIDPTGILADGVLGLLGVRHVFDHWTGDCAGSQPTCNVTMNGPKSVLAVWRDDYTITGIVMVSLLALATYFLVYRKRKRGSPRPRRSRR